MLGAAAVIAVLAMFGQSGTGTAPVQAEPPKGR
jgi:hypothetical protein